jgi:hypothetical protein
MMQLSLFLSTICPDKSWIWPAYLHPRLVIPVFRILFLDPKNVPDRIPEDFFSSCVTGIPVFSVFTGIFRRNSCGTGIPIYPGILQIPPDSGGFLFPPKAAGSGQRLKKALC